MVSRSTPAMIWRLPGTVGVSFSAMSSDRYSRRCMRPREPNTVWPVAIAATAGAAATMGAHATATSNRPESSIAHSVWPQWAVDGR